MNYQERYARQRQRAEEMLALKKQGKTLETIGTEFNLSRQRVHQILSEHFKEYPHSNRAPSNYPRVDIVCAQCGTIKSYVASHAVGRKFCNSVCWRTYRTAHKQTPEQRRECIRQLSRRFYQVRKKIMPRWKEYTVARNRAYSNKTGESISYKDFL